jgi:hypothetical protein
MHGRCVGPVERNTAGTLVYLDVDSLSELYPHVLLMLVGIVERKQGA